MRTQNALTVDQWHTRICQMSIAELEAQIENFEKQMKAMSQQDFEYHRLLQMRNDCRYRIEQRKNEATQTDFIQIPLFD